MTLADEPSAESPPPHLVLTTDARLQDELKFLLWHAIQRQIWLFFFDAEYRLLDPIMPMNDHPRDPYELHEIEDLGLVTFPELFIHRTQQIAEMIQASSYALIWERPGSDRYTAEDRTWVSEFVNHAGRYASGARLRALFLLHDGGVRQIAPDDYM